MATSCWRMGARGRRRCNCTELHCSGQLASPSLLQVTLHLPDVGVTAVSVLASFLLTGQVVIRSAKLQLTQMAGNSVKFLLGLA